MILDLFSSVSFDTVDVAIIFISQMTPLTIGLLPLRWAKLRTLTLASFAGRLGCIAQPTAPVYLHITSRGSH